MVVVFDDVELGIPASRWTGAQFTRLVGGCFYRPVAAAGGPGTKGQPWLAAIVVPRGLRFRRGRASRASAPCQTVQRRCPGAVRRCENAAHCVVASTCMRGRAKQVAAEIPLC